jgi:hypothetical protein
VIRSRVPYEEYAALPGVSITRLKELARSPKHYRHRLTHSLESAALTLGKAAHVAVLEPERFDRDHAVWGAVEAHKTEAGKVRPRNGKDFDAFVAANKGREILTIDERDDAMAIQRAVRGDETAMRYLASGDPEVTMQWATGAHRSKGRLDWLTKDEGFDVLVGLKTARDCRHFIFATAAAKLGYHLQWAYYLDGFTAITGRPAKVVEIVVESQPPHAVATFIITTDIIEQGRSEYVALLERLAECEGANEWPGPHVGEQHLTLPSWAYDRHDGVDGLGLEF